MSLERGLLVENFDDLSDFDDVKLSLRVSSKLSRLSSLRMREASDAISYCRKVVRSSQRSPSPDYALCSYVIRNNFRVSFIATNSIFIINIEDYYDDSLDRSLNDGIIAFRSPLTNKVDGVGLTPSGPMNFHSEDAAMPTVKPNDEFVVLTGAGNSTSMICLSATGVIYGRQPSTRSTHLLACGSHADISRSALRRTNAILAATRWLSTETGTETNDELSFSGDHLSFRYVALAYDERADDLGFGKMRVRAHSVSTAATATPPAFAEPADEGYADWPPTIFGEDSSLLGSFAVAKNSEISAGVSGL